MTDPIAVDVAVIGGGACGTMTALRAARNRDLTVAVFEKSTAHGCNAQISSGSLAAAGTRFQRAAGIEDSPQQHAEDIVAASRDRELSGLVLALCRAAPEYVEWLVDELDFPIELGLDMPRAGMSAPRLHTDVGRRGGRRLIGHLRAALGRLDNVAFVDESPAVGLLTGDEGVEGATVVQNGRRADVRARHVVLACDGFAANPALMRRHCPGLDEAFYGGVSTSTGDAVGWLAELGVPLRNMGACLRHGLVVAGRGTRLSPALPFHGAILVGTDGRRFVEETSVGYSGLAVALQRRPGGRAVLLWDEPAMAAIGESELMRESVAANAFRRYPSSRAVADAVGIEPAALERSLQEPRPVRALTAPFYAAIVTHGVLATQGGAVVDPDGRVLTAAGTPVPGLRAGGGTAVGLAGPDSAGYTSGNGLLAAFSLGWRIGNAIAGAPDDR